MANRFKNTLYTLGDYKRVGRHIRYVTNEDGTLFSGHYRTKIKPEDLPEWYLYGRYYKRFGYMSTIFGSFSPSSNSLSAAFAAR